MPDTLTTNLAIPDDICDICRPELQELVSRPAHGFDDLSEYEWEWHFKLSFCRYHHVSTHDTRGCGSCWWRRDA